MFTLLKVRESLALGDFRDPGWYAHPKGTCRICWTGERLVERLLSPCMEDTDMWHALDRGIIEDRLVADRSPEALHPTIDDAIGRIPGQVRRRQRWDDRP